MAKHRIHVGTENADKGFQRFTKAWEKAKKNQLKEKEVHLNFEDLPLLLSVLTPRRIELLKALRQIGPLSIRALAKHLSRDYKNVHGDAKALEEIGLIETQEDGCIYAPWDIIDAHLSLVA